MAIELDDGTIIRSLPEQVSYNDERIEDQKTRLTTLEAKVAAALAGVFHYKGSVATYGDLPATDNEVGDVWNVIDTGKNYAWSGSAWDDLGGIVDLSNLVTLNTVQEITANKLFAAPISFYDGQIDGIQDGLRIETNDSYFNFQSTYFFPTTDNTQDIGKASNKFSNVYTYKVQFTDNAIYEDTYKQTLFNINGTNRYAMSETDFSSYNQRDLGQSANKWKDLYLTETIYIGTGNINYSSNNISFNLNGTNRYLFTSSSFQPQGSINSNVIDLGASNRLWKNLYLGGNLSDGTNTVSFADLYALIQYAKAQGWIS